MVKKKVDKRTKTKKDLLMALGRSGRRITPGFEDDVVEVKTTRRVVKRKKKFNSPGIGRAF